ncbi:hypothetical protein BJP25_04130 [Actinokineospora bangkokensis]|uniref:Uncharacterized protein n=2 Tax=Actinokineospora bangkokensis TaxID=1193682 RepID=A0A1Q9LEB2_9PSEU|nr:hypothetical protein BJP25_04130 [Actinokineospora bangkokensis]
MLDLARFHQDSGDHIAATRLLARAAELEPAAVSILTELTRSQLRTAALTAAERTARRIVELAPADAYGHVLLGRALARQGKHREALPHLRLASTMSGEWQELVEASEERMRSAAA